MQTASNEEKVTAGAASSRAGEARRTQLEVSVSIRTILLVAGSAEATRALDAAGATKELARRPRLLAHGRGVFRPDGVLSHLGVFCASPGVWWPLRLPHVELGQFVVQSAGELEEVVGLASQLYEQRVCPQEVAFELFEPVDKLGAQAARDEEPAAGEVDG